MVYQPITGSRVSMASGWISGVGGKPMAAVLGCLAGYWTFCITLDYHAWIWQRSTTIVDDLAHFSSGSFPRFVWFDVFRGNWELAAADGSRGGDTTHRYTGLA